ncbi:MAG: FmdB family zinc ribbon protein [Gemmatimonas sp.]
MPIFEFVCKSCDTEFEALVRGSSIPACPKCSSVELERLLSMPYSHTAKTHANALKAAKRRDARQGFEREQTQREYEASHDDEGH